MAQPLPLNFTTTACCRPEVIQITYASFKEKLRDVDWGRSTIFLNIDPVPTDRVGRREAVIDVAKRTFGNVVVNQPETANFTAALKWCWTQQQNDVFFNLEDDWTMTKRVSVYELKYLLQGDVVIINLRAYKSIRDNRLCLSPGIVNGRWARDVATRLDINYNPEQQLQGHTADNECGGISDPKYLGMQFPICPNRNYVLDQGRAWLKQQGNAKNGDRFNFTTWVKS
ncbi:MAG: hypothetical protein HC888_03030 [Candidatus Competibacteraceae bacterium]|nr:hypothetical protein [Candidatus Competibacteraceae bacterium]